MEERGHEPRGKKRQGEEGDQHARDEGRIRDRPGAFLDRPGERPQAPLLPVICAIKYCAVGTDGSITSGLRRAQRRREVPDLRSLLSIDRGRSRNGGSRRSGSLSMGITARKVSMSECSL